MDKLTEARLFSQVLVLRRRSSRSLGDFHCRAAPSRDFWEGSIRDSGIMMSQLIMTRSIKAAGKERALLMDGVNIHSCADALVCWLTQLSPALVSSVFIIYICILLFCIKVIHLIIFNTSSRGFIDTQMKESSRFYLAFLSNTTEGC